MKKYVEIDGKKFLLKEFDGEEEKPEEGTEETGEDEEKGENLDEALDAAAQKIMSSLNIDGLQKQVAELTATLKGSTNSAKEKKNVALCDLAALMKKDVSELTAKEKIVGFFQALIQKDHAVLKALSEGTNADGGYLFPDEFRAEVIRDLREAPHMRAEVRVIPMTRDVMNIPDLQDRPHVTWTEENAAKSTTTAHFGQKTLTVKKMAAIMYMSDELVADSTEIDIVDFIITLFSEALGEAEDAAISAGNGTTQPLGYSGSGTGIATRAVVTNLSFDDIINLEYDLPKQYYSNAKFYINRQNIRELRKLKDNDGRYLWAEPVSAGLPPTLHGYPVVEDNNIPESKIFFGDLRRAYWLGDRQQMTVKISQDTETAFTKDQTALRVVQRIAGTVVLPQAMKALINIP